MEKDILQNLRERIRFVRKILKETPQTGQEALQGKNPQECYICGNVVKKIVIFYDGKEDCCYSLCKRCILGFNLEFKK